MSLNHTWKKIKDALCSLAKTSQGEAQASESAGPFHLWRSWMRCRLPAAEAHGARLGCALHTEEGACPFCSDSLHLPCLVHWLRGGHSHMEIQSLWKPVSQMTYLIDFDCYLNILQHYLRMQDNSHVRPAENWFGALKAAINIATIHTSYPVLFFFFKSSPEDMFIDLRERGW